MLSTVTHKITQGVGKTVLNDISLFTGNCFWRLSYIHTPQSSHEMDGFFTPSAVLATVRRRVLFGPVGFRGCLVR